MGNVPRWGCVRFLGDDLRPGRMRFLVRMSVVMVAQSRVGSVTMTVDTSSTGDAGVGAGAEHLAIAAAVTAGESVLSRRFGSAITLVAPEDLAGSGPAPVVRAGVVSSSFALPRTLVIKHYPDPPEPGVPDSFAHEAVSYQLFTALSPDERMCPELLAHDGGHRVLVLEDLGRTATL